MEIFSDELWVKRGYIHFLRQDILNFILFHHNHFRKIFPINTS